MSIFSKDALANKHILVTGATGGIGEEIVNTIVAMGAKVTASGRNIDKLNELKEKESNAAITTVKADIMDGEERQKLVEEALQKNGQLYGLVNAAAAAGSFGQDTIDTLQEKQLNHLMHTNWTASVLLTQLAYEKMIPQQEGSIVNIASLSGIRGTKGNTPYASSKFALIGFTQSLAAEAIEQGVRVNAVCPGYVDTDMGYNAILSNAKSAGRTYEEQLQLIKEQMLSGRITQPDEVAHLTAFLLTKAARNIVGESVKISGGAYM